MTNKETQLQRKSERLKNAISEAKAKVKNKKEAKNAIEAVEQYQDEMNRTSRWFSLYPRLYWPNLLFLEPPKPELMDLIKPILSHDHWEMEHPFVDKIGKWWS